MAFNKIKNAFRKGATRENRNRMSGKKSCLQTEKKKKHVRVKPIDFSLRSESKTNTLVLCLYFCFRLFNVFYFGFLFGRPDDMYKKEKKNKKRRVMCRFRKTIENAFHRQNKIVQSIIYYRSLRKHNVSTNLNRLQRVSRH